jgi:hypothetical protein
LVLGARSRAVAAAVTALAAVALAVAVGGRGCDTGDNTPEGAVRAFEAATHAGDRQAVYELLGPETKLHLEAAAKRATELVGGARRYDAIEMVAVGIRTEAPPAKSIDLSHITDGRAVVEVVSESGERSLLELVEVDGHWRIELDAIALEPVGAMAPKKPKP